MTQTSVSTTHTIAVAGMRGDLTADTRETGISEESSTEIRPGTCVKGGTAVDGVKIPAAQEDILRGIVVLDHTLHKDIEVGDDGYKPKAALTIVTKGRYWVRVESTLPTRASEVHVRAELTAAEPLGYFLAAAVSGKTIDITPFASWTGRTGTGIAELDFDFTMRNLATVDA